MCTSIRWVCWSCCITCGWERNSMAATCMYNLSARGYHVYQSLWSTEEGENTLCSCSVDCSFRKKTSCSCSIPVFTCILANLCLLLSCKPTLPFLILCQCCHSAFQHTIHIHLLAESWMVLHRQKSLITTYQYHSWFICIQHPWQTLQ